MTAAAPAPARAPSTPVEVARCLAIYVVLPNAAFLAFASYAYVVRPLVNLDYVLVGLASLVASRPVVGLAFALALLTDALVTIAPVFHFDVETAAASIAELFKLRLGVSLPLMAMILASALLLGWLATRTAVSPTHRRAPLIALATAALLTIAIDTAAGTSALRKVPLARLPVNVATSGAFRVVLALRTEMLTPVLVGNAPRAHAATTALRTDLQLPGGADSIGARHIALVIVESLGEMADSAAEAALLEPLYQPAIERRYTIRKGHVPVIGATTYGEMRELCGVHTDQHHMDHITVADCLPAQLRRMGFRTSAFHGFTQSFFERDRWYGAIGFEHQVFAEQMSGDSANHSCGVMFRGICDADVARLVHQELRSALPGERRFVYFLTLNSHFPIRAEPADTADPICARITAGQRREDICALARSLRIALSAMADIAADTLLPPTRFIVVGDHGPPFFAEATRALFRTRRVPFVELVPRAEAP